MLPAALPKTRRNGKLAEDAIDPYELVRRLSVVQAEAAAQELERKRIEWETSLLASRSNQPGHRKGHARTQAIPHSQSHKVHKRAKSIALAPNQLPPPEHADLAMAPRKQSHPLMNRSQYTAAPRRPSLKHGDSVLDLETINEDAVVDPSLDNLFLKAAKERRRSCAVRGVDENGAPNIMSAQPGSRGRSSLLVQKEVERLQLSACDTLSRSRRQSELVAQRRHSRLSDESPRGGSRTRSSLLEKMGEYLKAQSDQGSDAGDSDAFDSRGSTLRNSWRSSTTGSTSSRGPSILKKIEDYWVTKAPFSDDEGGVRDVHTDEEDPGVKHHASKRISGLFSKLRL